MASTARPTLLPRRRGWPRRALRSSARRPRGGRLARSHADAAQQAQLGYRAGGVADDGLPDERDRGNQRGKTEGKQRDRLEAHDVVGVPVLRRAGDADVLPSGDPRELGPELRYRCRPAAQAYQSQVVRGQLVAKQFGLELVEQRDRGQDPARAAKLVGEEEGPDDTDHAHGQARTVRDRW